MDNSSNFIGRIILYTTVAIVTMLVIGGSVWYFIEATKMNTEKMSATQNSEQSELEDQPTAEEPAQIRKGTFFGVEPKSGSGSVSLVPSNEGAEVVRLEDDFKVQEGPDLFVGFGNNGTVDMGTLFTDLEAFEGRQEYQVPESIDTSKYSQVFIYCKEFSATFAVAALQ